MGGEKAIIKRENDYIRAILPNSIGMEDGVDLEKEIMVQCEKTGTKLILDFSATNALYSSGIGLLIRLRKALMDKDGAIFLVNISKKLREIFGQLNLDRIFPMYGTDVEFDINSDDELWKKKIGADDNKFIFLTQVEDGMYRLTFSGHMSSMHDLSPLSEFIPQEGVSCYILNLESLELIDTYGAQLLNDFIERIRDFGAQVVLYGAHPVLYDVLYLFPALKSCKFFQTEQEAVEEARGK